MSTIITEKEYPIQNIWLLKQSIPLVVTLFLYAIFVVIITNINILVIIFKITWIVHCLIFIAVSLAPTIYTFLRFNFHYSINEEGMRFYQGVFVKKQRAVAYESVKNISVHQTFLDKVFRLASVTIDDYSNDGRSWMDADGYVEIYGRYANSRYEVVGIMGNRINIPGLKKEDAENLKEFVLQKMR